MKLCQTCTELSEFKVYRDLNFSSGSSLNKSKSFSYAKLPGNSKAFRLFLIRYYSARDVDRSRDFWSSPRAPKNSPATSALVRESTYV